MHPNATNLRSQPVNTVELHATIRALTAIVSHDFE